MLLGQWSPSQLRCHLPRSLPPPLVDAKATVNAKLLTLQQLPCPLSRPSPPPLVGANAVANATLLTLGQLGNSGTRLTLLLSPPLGACQFPLQRLSSAFIVTGARCYLILPPLCFEDTTILARGILLQVRDDAGQYC